MKVFNFDVEFASEAKELNGQVPAGYVDKTVCGCGLTSLAIEKEANNMISR